MDHSFEGWFSSSGEFERLQADGHLECPVCGSSKVEKRLMAPAVKSTKGKEMVVISDDNQSPAIPSAGSGQTVAAVQTPQLPTVPKAVREEVVKHLREFKREIMKNAENVGENFGEEARKMHYGEKEARGIYGTTSQGEAAELVDEGIEIMPLPVLPEDIN